MNSVSLTEQFVLGGESFQERKTVTAKGQEVRRVELPACKTGTLTTRTSNSVGEITGQAGHGIATGNIIDVYWSGGSRRGVTVGTVATNAIPITGGTGDNLPIATTTLTITKRETDLFGFSGDDVVGIFIYAQQKSIITFNLSGGTEAFTRVLPAGAVYTWVLANGDTNPLAGAAIDNLVLSQGSTVDQQTVLVAVLLN